MRFNDLSRIEKNEDQRKRSRIEVFVRIISPLNTVLQYPKMGKHLKLIIEKQPFTFNH